MIINLEGLVYASNLSFFVLVMKDDIQTSLADWCAVPSLFNTTLIKLN